MSKKLSKYISFLNYFGKYLIVLSVTSGGVSINGGSIVCNSWVICRNNKCKS